MKRSVATLMLVFLASTMGLVAADKWTGSIGDKMCGAKHMMDGARECTTACVKQGSPYVFIVGDQVYDIANQKDAKISAELAKHAGHTVEATGTKSDDGKNVTLTSIKMPAKK